MLQQNLVNLPIHGYLTLLLSSKHQTKMKKFSNGCLLRMAFLNITNICDEKHSAGALIGVRMQQGNIIILFK